MRVCRKCGALKPLRSFVAAKTSTAKRRHVCYACHEKSRRNPKKDRHNGGNQRGRYPQIRASIERWRERNKERVALSQQASNMVDRAIRLGAMVRAPACEACGIEGVRIEGAHYDYTDPLRVRWLCVPCHRMWDRLSPKTKST